MKYRWKKIIVNKQLGKYVIVKLFNKKSDLQEYYRDHAHDKKWWNETAGAHFAFSKAKRRPGKRPMVSKQTGVVLLHVNECGAGVVAHEFLHAVLWAHKHKYWKQQYPIVIKDMPEEERLLHNLTQAIKDFYNWFYSVTISTKKERKLEA